MFCCGSTDSGQHEEPVWPCRGQSFVRAFQSAAHGSSPLSTLLLARATSAARFSSVSLCMSDPRINQNVFLSCPGRVLKPAGPTLVSIRFCDADDLAVRAMNGHGGVRCPQCEPRSGATGVTRRSNGRPSVTLQNSESSNKSRVAGIMQWRVLNSLEKEMARRHLLTDSHASDARDRQRRTHGPDHAMAGSDWLRKKPWNDAKR